MASTENMPRQGDANRNRNSLEFNKFDAFFYSKNFVRTSGPVVARETRFDPNDAQPIYIGVNESQDAKTSASDWIVYKFTYDVSDCATRIQIAMGSWDGRAALF